MAGCTECRFITLLLSSLSCDSHVTRTTQYENPVKQAKRVAAGQMVTQMQDRPSLMTANAPPPMQEPPSWSMTAAMYKKQEPQPPQWQPEPSFHQYPGSGGGGMGFGYDNDVNRMENSLGGEAVRTVLMKNHQGFGFTIIGGDQRGDLLRIKSIVPGSVADRDGRLATGDVIVRINGTSVLTHTHQEVVDLFHSLPLHSNVMIEVRRTDDGAPRGFDNRELPPTSMSNNTFGSNSASLDQSGHLVEPGVKGEVKLVPIVKGPAGFGFSVVETKEGHMVKQIMDQLRCADLRVSQCLFSPLWSMLPFCVGILYG